MPKRQVFYSFHFDNDCWRTNQVRNIGVIEGNKPVSGNEWENIRKSDAAVEKWIEENMKYRSCVVVLVGSETANRKWVRHEIVYGWKSGKGVVGICIHNLKDNDGRQSYKGTNPFSTFDFGDKKFDQLVKMYDPPFSDSQQVYAWIEKNIENAIEEAIQIRSRY